MALALILTARAENKTSWLTLDLGAAYDLCACPAPKITIPVSTSETVKVSSLKAPVAVAAGFGALYDDKFRKAVRPAYEADGAGNLSAITLTLTPAEFTKTGTYTVLLEVAPTTETATLKTTRTTVQISHQAAKLSFPDKLRVSRVWYLPFWPSHTYDEARQLLRVDETGGKSDASILFGQRLPAARGTAIVDGVIQVEDQKAVTVPAGKFAQPGYSVPSSFPLGTVSGALEARAPEVADPVSLSYEVTSRLHWFYIIVYTFAGVLIGFWLKVKLAAKIERDEAKAKAAKALDDVKRAFSRTKDEQFTKDMKAPLEKLEVALKGNDVAALKKAVDDLGTALQTALTKLDGARQTEQNMIDTWKPIVHGSWPLPFNLAALVSTVAEEIDAAGAEVGDNPSGAKKQREKALTGLANGLNDGVRKWEAAAGDYASRLSRADRGYSDAVRKSFADEVAKISAVSLPSRNAVPDAAATAKALSDVINEDTSFRTAVHHLNQAIADEVRIGVEAVQEEQVPDQSALDQLQSTAKIAGAAIESGMGSPDSSLGALDDRLRELHQAWADALLKQLEKEPAKKAVQDLLAAAKYREAAVATAKAISGESKELTAEAVAAEVSDLDRTIWAASSPRFVPKESGFLTLLPLLSAPDLPAIEARTEGDLWWDKFVQSAILLVLLLIVAMFMYRDTFIGDFKDFVTIFSWAFGLDLTIASVIAVLPKKAA